MSQIILDPMSRALLPERVSELIEYLMRDMVGKPVSIKELVSDLPILVIRSANPTLFKSFLDALNEKLPNQQLVVLSHEKDREFVGSVVKNSCEFHGYPMEGPYDAEVVRTTMPDLLQRRFGAKVFLDASGVLGNLEHVIDLLKLIHGERSYAWNNVGPQLLALPDHATRFAARDALETLVRWCNSRFG